MHANGGFFAIRAHCRSIIFSSLLLLATILAGPIKAQDGIDSEFAFARGLIRLNLPDMAERAMERLVLQHPELQQRANVVRAEAMIQRRRLPAAEAILRDMPVDSTSAEAIRLALADAYFQVGERGKTREIYTAFFKRYEGETPTDPDLIRFLRESAYKYVQMLIMDQDYLGAVAVFDLLIKVSEGRDQSRQIMLEQAEIALKAADDAALSSAARESLYGKAEKNFNEVLWGGLDLWFGRALTSYAQYMVLRGDRDGARRMLQSNIRLMRDMDKQIREAGIPIAESPMAGARTLLGQLFLNEGQSMMAPEPERQAAALSYFERALSDYAAEWQLMERAKRREDAALERAREGGAIGILTATPERMRPYQDLLVALEQFTEILSGSAWNASVAERVRALDGTTRQLFNTVRAFDFGSGISPNLGIAIDENFRGNVAVRQGLLFLRPEEARKADAVQHYVRALTEYYNVFADYAGSHWSATASEVVARLQNILFDLTGRRVVIDTAPGQEEKVALVYIKEARAHFDREEYAQAVEKYLQGLNMAGENTEALVALSNLMESYSRLEQPFTVRMLAHYIAERFNARPEAAQALLRIGRRYFDDQNMEMYLYLYEHFLSSFPGHERAPEVLFMLGERQWMIKDYRAAAVYYQRIADTYPRSSQYLRALNRIGWGYFLAGEYDNAIKAFTTYLTEAPPSQEKAQAQLCLAESHRMLQQPVPALQAYRELIGWLEPADNPYTGSAEQRLQNQGILQQAEFFQAFCFSQLDEPADRIPQYRELAMQHYNAFVEKYPKSALAPTAMASLGAIYFERGRAAEAAQTFEALSERFPDSEAGQNARFAMIRSLIDIRQIEKAKEVFDEMLEDADRYSPGQFVRVGRLMLDRGEFAASEKAFLRVRAVTEERALLEPALFGLGAAQIELKKYADAVASLQDMIRRYPNSGRFFDARFLLGRALSEQDKYAEAIQSMHDVFSRASDAVLINRASLELAQLQLRGGQANAALASFQRIVLLGDPEHPDVRPMYEKALLGSIRLYRDVKDWGAVIENSDRYMRNFTMGAEAEQVRRWRSEALIERAQSGAG